jgi:hypothetical protein
MNARVRWLLLVFSCAQVACAEDEATIDAAIVVDASGRDASTLDGGASDAAPREDAAGGDAAALDAGSTRRLDVASCTTFDIVPREAEIRACAGSGGAGDCVAPHDGPAFAVVGRDLCAEALAASDGRARVQFAPAVDVREVSCDGLVLAPRASGDGVRIDFHGHAAVAQALANDAPFSVEAEAVIGASGCVASLVVRAPLHTIVLGDLPAVGGQLSIGTSTPAATIDVSPTFADGASCLGESAVCVTPSYGEETIVASLCSGSTWTYACGDYADYLAVGTTACGARMRIAHVVQSYVRICH